MQGVIILLSSIPIYMPIPVVSSERKKGINIANRFKSYAIYVCNGRITKLRTKVSNASQLVYSGRTTIVTTVGTIDWKYDDRWNRSYPRISPPTSIFLLQAIHTFTYLGAANMEQHYSLLKPIYLFPQFIYFDTTSSGCKLFRRSTS